MQKEVLVAPNELAPNDDRPVVFLAGPIMGARRWQDEAIEHLQKVPRTFVIANPRRALDREKNFTGEDYIRQVAWETRYLARAGRKACILFWLEREEQHHCSRPYAQTTRFELGEWFGRALTDVADYVIGMDDGFTGASYIRARMAALDNLDRRPIYASLAETCAAVHPFIPPYFSGR